MAESRVLRLCSSAGIARPAERFLIILCPGLRRARRPGHFLIMQIFHKKIPNAKALGILREGAMQWHSEKKPRLPLHEQDAV